MEQYPFAEYLLEDKYMSEEEDYYSPETYAAARKQISREGPSRNVELTEDLVYELVIRQPVEGIRVLVPSYRSKQVKYRSYSKVSH
ncbi:hypothetical protein G6F56_014612 [Rhizopus delemar]|nr:hypothetical protein G6F61_015057 [Rhizopus arrhizus]KAG1433358.1 hypothetical protein G6F56_014612 [Rhizopus delemar]